MKRVCISDININKIIKSTNTSYIMSCHYNNHEYCYKELLTKNDSVISNIEKLTELKPLRGLILPEIIVTDNNNNFVGYLSKLLKCNDTLEDMKNTSLEDKIKILNIAKKRIETMHNEYGITHGDLHTRNICVSSKLAPSIIDFDFVYNKEKLTIIARKYIDKNSYDYNLDKYIFNLTTYAFINDVVFRDVNSAISSGYNGGFTNKTAKCELNNLVRIKKPSNYLIDLI